MFVIGTAGHVDHGKSLLVQALTGIDPDRLREEKARGMTIDLGFAWLTLPSGREVSIVDVPGHERFIRNMLAGAGGIDLALLVVAADEGVMPQTREHLAILDLLGIERGVLVITKKDLVDDDTLAVVSDELRGAMKASTLGGSPIVVCSAATGEGLDNVRRVLDEQLQATEAKRDIGRPRLPVDRSFTIAGFGTVVTGTLVDGCLEVGQEVEIVPSRLHARIRGLQNHQQQVERAMPGRRTAVNVSGLAKDDVRRGDVLSLPGLIASTTAVDVRVRAIQALRHPLRHGTTLTLHIGAAEVEARLLLLDREELQHGDRAWAQLRLSEPAAAVKGDRFVLRTPNDTVAGGEVADEHGARHRRFHRETIETLEALSSTFPERAFVAALRRIEPAMINDVAKELGVSDEQARAAAEEAPDAVVMLGDGVLISQEGFVTLTERAKDTVGVFHEQYPLRRGMSREELRSRLRLDERAAAGALSRWTRDDSLRIEGEAVALRDFVPALNATQQNEADAYVNALEGSPYMPPVDARPLSDVLAYLIDRRRVVDVGDGVVFARVAYDEVVARITEHLRGDSITLGQLRDMFGSSRKYAQALLEHLDREHVTRRVGDVRVLRESPGKQEGGAR